MQDHYKGGLLRMDVLKTDEGVLDGGDSGIAILLEDGSDHRLLALNPSSKKYSEVCRAIRNLAWEQGLYD